MKIIYLNYDFLFRGETRRKKKCFVFFGNKITIFSQTECDSLKCKNLKMTDTLSFGKNGKKDGNKHFFTNGIGLSTK